MPKRKAKSVLHASAAERVARRHAVSAIAAVCACILSNSAVRAAAGAEASYPNRPIRMVVPFPPGGPNDTLARIIAQGLSQRWGQNIVIDNRAGGAGIIGTEIVARSVPDGYTLIAVGSNIATNVSLYKKLPYDAIKDFSPVTLVASTPYVLVVHPSLNVSTVQELIAVAKAKPGGLSYASASAGSANHLAGELFNKMADVKMVHIPYKGGGPALTDVIAGHVQLIFNNPLTVLGHVRAGRLKALALTSAKRSPVVPGLPTISEAGLQGFDITGWYGVLAPAHVPPEIIGKLHKEIVALISTAEMRERLLSQGLEPVGNTPREYSEFIAAEIRKWAKVVAESGARID